MSCAESGNRGGILAYGDLRREAGNIARSIRTSMCVCAMSLVDGIFFRGRRYQYIYIKFALRYNAIFVNFIRLCFIELLSMKNDWFKHGKVLIFLCVTMLFIISYKYLYFIFLQKFF